MPTTWLVLLPPFIVLFFVFITKKLNLSLTIGIIIGAYIAADFSVIQTGTIVVERLYTTLVDVDNLQMYAFLFMISILVVLLNRTGAANAFAQMLTNRLSSARAAESSSVLLSISLFLDDYLSGLTTGLIMRPITDRFHIPRTKLAYLVHSMTGPLVILVPVSSWVAMITTTLDTSGVSTHITKTTKIIADPFFIYLESIPYIFYSFLTLASVWFIVRNRISYGPMYIHEKIAHDSKNLFGNKKPLTDRLTHDQTQKGTLADLIVPLVVLLTSVFIGSLIAGEYYLFGGTHSMLEAFKYNKIYLVLFSSGCIALISSFLFSLVRRRINIQEIPSILIGGIHLMKNAVIMVILASILSKIIKTDLGTGNYLAGILYDSLSMNLLPFIFFIVSSITAMLTGSSWGTIMLLTPIAIPMLTKLALIQGPASPASIPLLFPVLGAIFSGSVCGDHLSPISETTIMAATSSGAYPLDHAYTQFPYAIPAIISTALGFLLSGFLSTYSLTYKLFLPLGISVLTCYALLLLFNKTKCNK